MTHQTPHSFRGLHGLSDRMLERFLCDDLSDEEKARVQRIVDTSPELTAYLAERRQDKAAFAATHPFAPIRAKLDAPVRRSLFSARWGLWLVPSAALAGLIAIIAVGSTLFRTEEPHIQVRGGMKAELVVKRADAVLAYGPAMALVAGDALRLNIEDPVGGWLWVLGLDEKGAVGVYYGAAQNGGPLFVRPGTFLTPDSLIVDDSRTREALYVVLGDRQLPEATLTVWLAAASSSESFPPHPQPLAGTRYAVLPLLKDAP